MTSLNMDENIKLTNASNKYLELQYKIKEKQDELYNISIDLRNEIIALQHEKNDNTDIIKRILIKNNLQEKDHLLSDKIKLQLRKGRLTIRHTK